MLPLQIPTHLAMPEQIDSQYFSLIYLDYLNT